MPVARSTELAVTTATWPGNQLSKPGESEKLMTSPATGGWPTAWREPFT